METVNIYEAKTKLSQLVDKAAAGEDVVVCRRRSNFEPPCRLNIEPGTEADVEIAGCG
jgi:hypothetical protein